MKIVSELILALMFIAGGFLLSWVVGWSIGSFVKFEWQSWNIPEYSRFTRFMMLVGTIFGSVAVLAIANAIVGEEEKS